MISIAIIIFREILEIALILGVLLAATRGLAGRSRWVWSGTLGGILGAALVAYFAETISGALQGMGQEVFNAMVLLLAATLIAWTVVWMQRHGRQLTQHLKKVGESVTKGDQPLYTLAVVASLAVLREGSEIVLFTYGVLASGEKAVQLFIGSAVGFLMGAAAGAALYYGLIKISARKLFSVTSWMLVLLAAGMVSQAAGYLVGARVIPGVVSSLWDTSRIIPEESLIGKILHALLGYSERPSAIQLIGYLFTLGAISIILKRYGNISSETKNDALQAKKVAAGLLLVVSSWFLAHPREALATKKVYSPIVQKGELELEARGSYDFDDKKSKNSAQKQKYAVGYGVTDRWFTELYGEIEKESNKDFEFVSVDWENIYQLFEQGKYWLDAGLYLEYEFAVREDQADEIEGKLLLEKSLTGFTHTLNLIVAREVGKHSKDEVEAGLAWSSRYRWHEYLEPGLELHSDFGELGEGESFSEQKHQLGPVFYGRIGKHIRYDIGYLFGISSAASDGTFKWILEYEKRF